MTLTTDTYFASLLASYTAQIQAIEDMLFDLYTQRALTTAVGAQLDGIGRLVQLGRDGRDDDTYRAALGVEILILNTSGTAPQLVPIIEGTVFNTYAYAQREGTTSVDLDFTADVGDSPTPLALAKIIRRVIVAGVRCVIAWDDFFGIDGRTEAFSFGPSADIDGHSGGLGNGAGTTGGYFIRASDGETLETLV